MDALQFVHFFWLLRCINSGKVILSLQQNKLGYTGFLCFYNHKGIAYMNELDMLDLINEKVE